MQRQSLNVNVQPIMMDMNSIIETHINNAVKSFNIQYINREILEHKKKITQLEEELDRIQTGDYIANENIHLEIADNINTSETECEKENTLEGSANTSVIKEHSHVPVDKTNKVVSIGDEAQTKKVVMNYFDQFVNKPDTPDNTPVAVPQDETNEVNPEDEEDEDEEGVFEIEVDGVSYYTTDEMNGDLYTIDPNGDPDEMIGKLIDGEATLNN